MISCPLKRTTASSVDVSTPRKWGRCLLSVPALVFSLCFLCSLKVNAALPTISVRNSSGTVEPFQFSYASLLYSDTEGRVTGIITNGTGTVSGTIDTLPLGEYIMTAQYRVPVSVLFTSGDELTLDKNSLYRFLNHFDIFVSTNSTSLSSVYLDDVNLLMNITNLVGPYSGVAVPLTPQSIVYQSSSTVRFRYKAMISDLMPISDYSITTSTLCCIVNFYLCWSETVEVHIDNGTNIQDVLDDLTGSFSVSSSAVSDLIWSSYDTTEEDSVSEFNNDFNEYHTKEENTASSTGSDIQGLYQQFDSVQSNWSILWYPITFTNNVWGAIQGTSSANYQARFGNISGYQYDDNLGELVPILATARSGSTSQAVSSGATINFPSFTLPVLNVQLWDGYSYDISQLRDQYSDLFSALDVFVVILETYWFVSFLRKKYEEVFG